MLQIREFLVFPCFCGKKLGLVMTSLCESVVKEALVLGRKTDSYWAQVCLGLGTVLDFWGEKVLFSLHINIILTAESIT
jgi:hypothetical protein